MSAKDASTQNRNFITIKDPHPAVMLSLNEIFKESMKKAHAGQQGLNLIMRCESLPLVKAQRGEMETVFTTLIRLILQHPVTGSKRFLYIDCEERIQKQQLQKDQKQYLIKFHTNGSTNDNWKEANRVSIDKCEKILSAHHGSLTVNNIDHTGCLFCISLPGKFD
jgi:hypothetical protein